MIDGDDEKNTKMHNRDRRPSCGIQRCRNHFLLKNIRSGPLHPGGRERRFIAMCGRLPVGTSELWFCVAGRCGLVLTFGAAHISR